MPLRISQINAVNKNVGVKEKKNKQTEKGSVTIDKTEAMMFAKDIKEMTTDIVVKAVEIKRITRRNERHSATNQVLRMATLY